MGAERRIWVGCRIAKSDHMRLRRRLKDAKTNASEWINTVIKDALDRPDGQRRAQSSSAAAQ